MLVPALLVLFSNILSSSAWTDSCECYPASYVQSYYPNRQIVVKTQDHQPRAIPVNSQPVPVYPQPVPVYPQPVPVNPQTVPVNPQPVPVYPQPVPVYLQPVPVNPRPTPLSPINPRPTPLSPINPRPNPVDPPRPYYPGPFPLDESTALSPIDPDARPPYLDNPNHPQPKEDPIPPSPLEPIDQSQPAPNYRRMGGSALSELLSLPGAVAESFLSGEIKI